MPWFIPEWVGMQQVNLWLGGAPVGERVSSRLHHDMHDNVAGVVSGVKHYQLWSPDSAASLYPVGSLRAVSAGGVISYDSGAAGGEHFSMLDPRLFSSDDAEACSAARAMARTSMPTSASEVKECACAARACAQRRFPLFETAPTATATLHAGEFIYIPAGWFHLVSSESAPTSTPTAAAKHSSAGLQAHIAVNFWFNPYST